MLDTIFSGTVGENAAILAADGVPLLLEEKAVQEEIPDPLYEMMKDTDVGTLLPSTKDAIEGTPSVVLAGSDPSDGYLIDDNEEELTDEDSDEEDLKGAEEATCKDLTEDSDEEDVKEVEEATCKGQIEDSDEEDVKEAEEATLMSESDDPVAQRNVLLAQMQVLDAMLQRIEAEERQRELLEGPQVNAAAANNKMGSSYLPTGQGVSNKRQRRPNPKYFGTEIEADFLAPGSSPSMAFRSYDDEFPGQPLGFSDCKPLESAGHGPGYKNGSTMAHASTVSASFFDRSSGRPAGTHRARTALAQKPRVFSTPDGTARVFSSKSDSNLDNLSIRELHEAYRAIFGKDTSVKDKHWLKRQIFTGSSKQKEIKKAGKENNKANAPLLETAVKSRLEKFSSAEEPLSTIGTLGRNEGVSAGGVGSPYSSPPTAVSSDTKKSYLKTVSLATLPPLSPAKSSPSVEDREALNTENKPDYPVAAQNKEIPVGGKRVRKPNRRYIEDEGEGSLIVTNGGSQSILSTLLSAGNELRSHTLRFPWRSGDGQVAGDGYKNGAVRNLRASTRSSTYHGRRSKHGTNAMKRKNEGRAAKLVKMAHSARAARHDSDGPVRKVKFRLPAAPGQDKGDGLNGEGEQVSCLLPVLTDESSDDYQVLSSHYLTRLEDTSNQAVVTVPTANGGTRRKHHRPWTLREVVTLVEGVARCGGGKWADIKKLAFSAVGYRTAVDLKDKWRNLLRASRAQLHPPKQGETRKKQFSAAIPNHILAKVRELAALNDQATPATSVATSTSRSGRTVHRR